MAASDAVLARRRANAWVPPPEPLAAAQAHPWRGDPQPQLTRQEPIGPGVVWLGRRMRAMFPGLIYQTYARGRTVPPGRRPNSMHHAGRAIDLMIREVGGRPDRRGDEVANWLLAHARELGVQYMIWSGTQWSSASGRVSVYPGGEDHFNHVHVDLSDHGAQGSLPWYADMDPALRAGRSFDTAPALPGGADASPADDEASPPVDLVITPEEAGIATGPSTLARVAAGLAVAAGAAAAAWAWWRRRET